MLCNFISHYVHGYYSVKSQNRDPRLLYQEILPNSIHSPNTSWDQREKSISDNASEAASVRRYQLDNFLVSLQLSHQCAFYSGSFWLKSHHLGQSSRIKLTKYFWQNKQCDLWAYEQPSSHKNMFRRVRRRFQHPLSKKKADVILV